MSEEDKVEIRQKQFERWYCPACKFPLAWVENRKQIRFKRRDLYIIIEGGKVTTNCPRCGRINEIEDAPEIKEEGGTDNGI